MPEQPTPRSSASNIGPRPRSRRATLGARVGLDEPGRASGSIGVVRRATRHDHHDPRSPPTQPCTGSQGVSAAHSAGVVLIDAQTPEGTAAGTGMVLSADGKVLTNYHVVAGSSKVEVTLADSGDSYDAEVLGFDQAKDVALLQLEGASGLTTVSIDGDEVRVADAVAAVGNANGRGTSSCTSDRRGDVSDRASDGARSPWGAEEDLSGMIQTDASAVPGDSVGSAMFDTEGEVLGMTTAGSTGDGTSRLRRPDRDRRWRRLHHQAGRAGHHADRPRLRLGIRSDTTPATRGGPSGRSSTAAPAARPGSRRWRRPSPRSGTSRSRRHQRPGDPGPGTGQRPGSGLVADGTAQHADGDDGLQHRQRRADRRPSPSRRPVGG